MGLVLVLLLGFLSGIAFTLAALLFAVVKLMNIYQGPSLPPPIKHEQFSASNIPKMLADFYKKGNLGGNKPEPAEAALNTLLMFLFQELKHTDKIRSWFRKKVEVELAELKQNAALKMVIRDLRLLNFDVGSSLPLVQVLSVDSRPPPQPGDCLQCVDIIVDVTYTGCLSLSLEALISFDRTLKFDCKIQSLSGKARLQFNRHPYTHWSFSFIQDPAMNLDLKTNINGRNLPQVIIPILTNQIKRLVRRKHTLPAYKMRIKPFFGGITYTETPKESPSSATQKQELGLTLMSFNRLLMDTADCQGLFTIITLDTDRYSPRLPYRETSLTITLEGDSATRLKDITVKRGRHSFTKRDVVYIQKIKTGSEAEKAKLVKGHVITHIDGAILTSVHTITQIKNLLTKAEQTSVQLTVCLYEPLLPDNTTVSPSQSTPLQQSSNIILTNSTDDTYVDVNSLPLSRSPRSNTQLSSDGSTKQTKSPENCKISAITSEDIKSSGITKLYKTHTVRASTEPLIDEYIQMTVETEHVYLNVILFGTLVPTQGQTSSQTDTLIGYASVSLYDVLIRCEDSTQSESLLSVNLSPPPDVDQLLAPPGGRSLDVTKCYGDVKLKFSTDCLPAQGEGTPDPSDEFTDIELPASSQDHSRQGSPQRSPRRAHDFLYLSFPQAVSCAFCLKKIWMKKAFQCSKCSIIVHKKCEAQCQVDTKCTGDSIRIAGEPPSPTLLEDEGALASVTPGTIRSLGSKGFTLLSYPKRAAKKAAQVSALYVQQKLRNRRRRFALDAPDNEKEFVVRRISSKDEGSTSESEMEFERTQVLPTNSLDIPEHKSLIPGHIVDGRSSSQDVESSDHSFGVREGDVSSSDDDTVLEDTFMKQYYTSPAGDGSDNAQAAATDEMVATDAKQMGKELFATLNVDERKIKLESKVEQLQQEIEMVSTVRDEHQKQLKSISTAAQKAAITTRIDKANEKIQALAVLLLHYCSGLQDCADQLENLELNDHQTSHTHEIANIPTIQLQQPSDNSMEISVNETVPLGSVDALNQLEHKQLFSGRTRSESSDSSDWQNISDTEIH